MVVINTLLYGYDHTLADFDDYANEKSIAMAELYGHSEFHG